MTRQQLLWLFIWMFIFFLFFCIWSKLPANYQTEQNATVQQIKQPVIKEMHLKILKEEDSATISGVVSSEDAKNKIVDAYGKVFQTVHTGGLMVDKEIQASPLLGFFSNLADNFSQFDTGYIAYNNGQLEVDGTTTKPIVAENLEGQLAQLSQISIDNTFVLTPSKAPSDDKVTQPVVSETNSTNSTLQADLDSLFSKKRVQFLYARDILTRHSKTLLDAVVALLKDKSVSIEISGHTDSDGSQEDNLKLSQKRAESIKAYMLSQGMDEKRLNAVGYGESRPLVNNKTLSNRRRNRRVEFKIIGEQ